jgi:hypothetical protein
MALVRRLVYPVADSNTDFFHSGVVNVAGLVTAKGPNGFWIRSPEPDNNDRTSER